MFDTNADSRASLSVFLALSLGNCPHLVWEVDMESIERRALRPDKKSRKFISDVALALEPSLVFYSHLLLPFEHVLNTRDLLCSYVLRFRMKQAFILARSLNLCVPKLLRMIVKAPKKVKYVWGSLRMYFPDVQTRLS